MEACQGDVGSPLVAWEEETIVHDGTIGGESRLLTEAFRVFLLRVQAVKNRS